jgi:hypothetical protein
MGWPHLVARALQAAQPGEENLTLQPSPPCNCLPWRWGRHWPGWSPTRQGWGGWHAGDGHAARVLLALFTLAPAWRPSWWRAWCRTGEAGMEVQHR